MSTFYYVPQYFTTQLSVAGGIDDSQTTGIVLQSITGVDETKPGIIAISWSNPIDTTKVEYITYTSINPSTKELQGVTRGAEGYSAKSHVNGATIAWPLSKSHINNIPDSTTTFTNKTLTSPILQGTVDGWISANETWTYASATTITVPSGAASKYAKGDKIKLTQTTVKYFYIIGVADTVLTVTGGSDYTVANAAISANYYSHQSSPIGFPGYFNFTPTISWTAGTAPSSPTQNSKFFITGNIRTDLYNVIYGSNGTTVTGATIAINSSGGGDRYPLIRLRQDITDRPCFADVRYTDSGSITITCSSATVNRLVGTLQYNI